MTTKTKKGKDTATKPQAIEVIPPAGKREHLKQYYFKPGNKMGGRPKGSRSKFAECFLKDFIADWELFGVEVLMRCRKEDPSSYLRVAAAILPKELNIREGESVLETLLERFGDQQLDEFIAGVIALGASKKSAGAEVKTITRAKSNSVH